MTEVIRFCDVIENCEDCPVYGDVCDGCDYKKTDWSNPKNEDCYCSNCASENYGYNVDLIAKCDMKGE